LARLEEGAGRTAGFGRAEHVGGFFADLAVALEPKSVLDPFAATPVVAAAISETISPKTTAICPSAPVRDIGAYIAPEVEWQVGSPPALVSNLGGDFDLIACSPPIGLRAGREWDDLETAVPPTIYRSNVAHLVLCLAANKLAPGGKMAFLLGQGSLFRRDGLAMRKYLAKMGIGLEASISMREGLAPATHIETQVAIYSRAVAPQLFVARVAPKSPRTAIVGNLLAAEDGPEMELGLLVDRDGYRGWERARLERELESLLGDDSSLVALGSLARVERLRVERGDPDPGLDNVVYLPEAGTGPARLQVDWAGKRESRSLVALVLDDERVEAGYVAQWLNSSTGKLARGLTVEGSVIPHARVADIKALRIPLPSVKEQRRSVRLRRQIVGARAELEILAERVASDGSQGRLGTAEEELRHLLGSGDDLDAWARRLPFPVASILAQCLAVVDPAKRFEKLLFFFEALAALLATLLLSAARSSELGWAREGGRAASLRRASFGSWIRIGVTLSRCLRDVLGEDGLELDAAGAEARTAALGVADLEFCTSLIDEEVWSLLDQAKTVRNRQKGHGGAISDRQLEARVRELEQLLGDLHQRASMAFDQVMLVQPGVSGYDGDFHRFAGAKRLVGPSGTFPERPVTTVFPLKEDAVFLADRREHVESMVEVLPFVRLLPSPDTGESVCYFYTELDGDDLRFISYHLPRTESMPLAGSGIADMFEAPE
jgi:hypothetical protein